MRRCSAPRLKLWPWGRSWRWYQSGFYPGEVTALMGPNGAGKSTLALTLAGLLKPIAGKVLIADNLKPAHAGREPIDWKSKELLGRIGMVFQEPEHQFAANFVRDEVSIGPSRWGRAKTRLIRPPTACLSR